MEDTHNYLNGINSQHQQCPVHSCVHTSTANCQNTSVFDRASRVAIYWLSLVFTEHCCSKHRKISDHLAKLALGNTVSELC